MNRVYFKHTLFPCVDNEITRWHLENGWLWDVYDRKLERNIGVFFATLLCGDGCIIHFYTVNDITLDGAALRCAFRRGIELVSPFFNVVYATIPTENKRLIRCICRFGFKVCPGADFYRSEQNISLLKYLPHSK